jgi:UDP-N-acetylglucosamine:LPS N-acetylglucosamine transferase
MVQWRDHLPRWPGHAAAAGFPISRAIAAFDFSVSAAGYNTFHEVIAQGLPTIFVPNRHPSMDDQGARAEFAQDHGAGSTSRKKKCPFPDALPRDAYTSRQCRAA